MVRVRCIHDMAVNTRLSNRKNPHVSVSVINGGPDATAESELKRFNNSVTVPPIETAVAVFVTHVASLPVENLATVLDI